MVLTRLLHLPSMSLEPFEISDMPEYVALSHVWSESLFPVEKLQNNQVKTSDGLVMLQKARAQREEISDIVYAWIDTWCIDQSDPEDKKRQIPMMGDVYRQARAVVVVVRHEFSFTQADWDDTIEGSREPMDYARNPHSRNTDAAYDLYRSDRYTPHLKKGLEILREICSLGWMKRVWTAQEYALAARVLFIGEDLRSFGCLPTDMNMLLLVNEFKINEALTDYGNVGTLNNICDKRNDSTLIMGLAKDRAAAYEVDKIYGLMGAAEVIIPPIDGLDVGQIWKLWVEAAINAGHLLWIMLPLYDYHDSLDCLVPSFENRCLSLSQSLARRAEPLGPTTVYEGSVSFTGIFAGQCEILTCLGQLDGPAGDLSTKLVAEAKGDVNLSRQMFAAISSGQSSAATEKNLNWSCQLYYWKVIESHMPLVTDPAYKEMVRKFGRYNGLIYSMIPDGKYCLAVIRSQLKSTPVLLRVDRSIPKGTLIAIDVNATGGADLEEEHVFMVAAVPGGEERQGQTLHKVGTTSIVFVPNDNSMERALELNGHVFDRSLETFIVGGKKCWVCSSQSKECTTHGTADKIEEYK